MPSRGALWNLAEYLRRMGENESNQPPIARGVQPVLVMGDATKLTTPLNPNMAFFGGFRTSAAGQNICFAIRTLAPGGCWVRWSTATSTGIEGWHYQIVAGAFALASVVNPVINNLGPRPIEVDARIGDAVTGGATIAIVEARIYELPPIFLPNGVSLVVSSQALATLGNFFAMVEDVPAIVPSA